ncbi:MAG: hypothetical protein OEZ02_07865 [Anaerolineae bacterium]|nr:hypothetical protein [Anaerolineae bacterium]
MKRKPTVRERAGLDSSRVFAFGLTLVGASSLVHGAAAIVKGLSPGMLWSIGLLGLMLGWWLAQGRMPGKWAALIGICAGVLVTFVRVGSLEGKLWKLLVELEVFLEDVIQQGLWRFTRWLDIAPLRIAYTSIKSGAVREIGLEVAGDFIVMAGRLGNWLQGLQMGSISVDPVALVLVWGLTTWSALMWLSWGVRRLESPVMGSGPTIVILASSLAYSGGEANYLLPILAATLAMLIMINYQLRERGWRRQGAKFPSRIRKSLRWVALGLSVGLVSIAAISPTFSIEEISDFIDERRQAAVERTLAESLGLEAKPEEEKARAAEVNALEVERNAGLPTVHLIGSGPELSERVVMVIKADELRPELLGIRGDEELTGRRYYWRSLTYDSYSGRGWYTVEIEAKTYAAGELAVPSSLPRQRVLRQQVSMVEDRRGFVYIAGILVTVDQNYRVSWRVQSDPAATPDAFGAAIGSTNYRADSLLPIFSEDELRATDQDYPEEIARRYLRLPDSVPDRVLALALELTATEATAYDRALAIEAYLRTFPYTLDLPPPPSGVDVDIADYFLFTLQKGYCDYYATTMAVLARAAGLPARMVYGYMGDVYDKETDRYIITEDKAHTWVEIYFPGYGWIEFEPTAGRPEIERVEKALPEVPIELDIIAGQLEPIEETFPEIILPEPYNWTPWIQGGQILIGVLAAAVILWPSFDLGSMRLRTPQAVILLVFKRVYLYARHLGMAAADQQTAYEFVEPFWGRIADVVENKYSPSLTKKAQEELNWLTDRFVRLRYGKEQPGKSEKERAIRVWRSWRKYLWLARRKAILQRFSRMLGKRKNFG